MTTEFNLSEKVRPADHKDDGTEYYWQEDVKEFIRLLKKELSGDWIYDRYELGNSEELIKFINKLAGEKLR